MTFNKKMVFERVLLPGLKDLLLKRIDTFKKIFLVGGTIRDFMLGLENVDLDFAVEANAHLAAKLVANFFGGSFFMLDEERNTSRAIVYIDQKRYHIDFALLRGRSIEDDLKARDFTINAMAVDIEDLEKLIDPLNALTDIQKRILKLCLNESLMNDPVRAVRAIRFIQAYGLDYDNQVIDLIQQASSHVFSTSVERVRDEIFNIFEFTDIQGSLDLMQDFGLFKSIFPELLDLKLIPAYGGHVHDGLYHTIRVAELVQKICRYFQIGQPINEDKLLNPMLSELESFRDEIRDYLTRQLNPHRSLQGLLVLTALYHDLGKVEILKNETIASDRFPGHAIYSEKLFNKYKWKFALSNDENAAISQMLRCHMSEHLKLVALTDKYQILVYKFYREAGQFGVLVVLFHLADLIATYEENLTDQRGKIAITSAKRLLKGWFYQREKMITPKKLIDGNDLMQVFNLSPGRHIGDFLEIIREAQVEGKVSNRHEALELISFHLNEGNHDARETAF